MAPASNAYYVQVAAVSKAEDATALVDALKKKQYPAFSTNTPTDKLIHVQVGPYADIKDAEPCAPSWSADGYNPILKKVNSSGASDDGSGASSPVRQFPPASHIDNHRFPPYC